MRLALNVTRKIVESVSTLLIVFGLGVLALSREAAKRLNLSPEKGLILGVVSTELLLLSVMLKNYLANGFIKVDLYSDFFLLIGIFVVVPAIVGGGFYKDGVSRQFKQ